MRIRHVHTRACTTARVDFAHADPLTEIDSEIRARLDGRRSKFQTWPNFAVGYRVRSLVFWIRVYDAPGTREIRKTGFVLPFEATAVCDEGFKLSTDSDVWHRDIGDAGKDLTFDV